ncbi:winged helix-turn-helix domain-containing protein [Streptomyces mirabilis]|uniref:winged helix-turn-helix domain-containing protein n=1 Tax=Streptomyces mirabilis TaxID=68239 RepID=UPI00201E5C3D|nr:helix-turn-helix domain-containing protein [Streptomyces mirabilis]
MRLPEEPGAARLLRQRILDTVWEANCFGPTRTLAVHIAALRSKLGAPRGS